MSYTYDTEATITNGWLGINSTYIYGTDIGSGSLSTMLNGTGALSVVGAGASPWSNQEFFLDLGESLEISSIRYRSNVVGDVNKFDVFLSETYGSWGSAVASNLDPSATSSYRETSITPTVARYVRVLIKDATFGSLGVYTWGGVGVGNGFDLYGAIPYQYDEEQTSGFSYNNLDTTYNNVGVSYNQNSSYSYDSEP